MKGAFLDTLSDGAIDALVAAAQTPSSLLSAVHLHHLGGAVAHRRVGDAVRPSARRLRAQHHRRLARRRRRVACRLGPWRV
jgi:fructose-1,6-bisphosphatase/sedoheptulose 1,7-bisphosphatase-like protein